MNICGDNKSPRKLPVPATQRAGVYAISCGAMNRPSRSSYRREIGSSCSSHACRASLKKTTYARFEIVLIDNGSRETAAREYLALSARDPRTRVLQCNEEFNYSRLCNFGVEKSKTDFVVLMNNDVEVIAPDWLEEMVSHGIQPEVGAVGARLLYPDGRVQQAGVILGAGVHGVAEVAHRGIAQSDPGYFSRAILAQELSALGAACMLVRREVYLEAGGFDEKHLKVAFNDIDFCLKLRDSRLPDTLYA